MNARVFSPRVIFFIFLIHIVEISVFPIFFKISARIPLTFLLVLYAAFQWHWHKSIPMAILVGLLHDVTGSLPFGVITASLVVATYLLNFVIHTIERYSLVMRLLTTFLFILSVIGLQIILSSFLGQSVPSFGYALKISFLEALLSTACMPFFFGIATRWFKDQAYLRTTAG